MIKVISITIDQSTKQAKVDLFSDTKSEVVPGATIVGLPADVTIAQSSSVFTASGDLGFMKSDGTWNWT